MFSDHEIFDNDAFGTSADEDAVYLSQLQDQDPRTLCQGTLVNGEQIHVYLGPRTPILVVVRYQGEVLLQVDQDEMLYLTQIGSLKSLDPRALDPEFSEHLVRIGVSPDLMTPGQYEKRLHEPVLSSLNLP